MPRTETTIQDFTGSAQGSAIEIDWTDFDTANGMSFECDGRQVLLVRNAEAVGADITVVSVPLRGRSGDEDFTVPPGEVSKFGPIEVAGFRQNDGMAYLNCADDCEVAVLQWPF